MQQFGIVGPLKRRHLRRNPVQLWLGGVSANANVQRNVWLSWLMAEDRGLKNTWSDLTWLRKIPINPVSRRPRIVYTVRCSAAKNKTLWRRWRKSTGCWMVTQCVSFSFEQKRHRGRNYVRTNETRALTVKPWIQGLSRNWERPYIFLSGLLVKQTNPKINNLFSPLFAASWKNTTFC